MSGGGGDIQDNFALSKMFFLIVINSQIKFNFISRNLLNRWNMISLVFHWS